MVHRDAHRGVRTAPAGGGRAAFTLVLRKGSGVHQAGGVDRLGRDGVVVEGT